MNGPLSQSAAERRIADGEAAFQAGDVAKARAFFLEALAGIPGLAGHPGHPRLLNDLGVLACHDADWDAAERHFEAAHAANPRERKYLANLAELLIARERNARAHSLLTAFFAAVGEDADLRKLWRETAPAAAAQPQSPPRTSAGGEPPQPAKPRMPVVVWQNRADMDAAPGGDTTLVREMVASLERLGVPVRMALEDNPGLSGTDLVHLNNISRTKDTLAQLRNAKAQGKPVVLTPLYEDMDRYLAPALRNDVVFRFLAMNKRVLPLEQIDKVRDAFQLEEDPLDQPMARMYGIGDVAKQQVILDGADLILTSGATESESIRRKFGRHLPLAELHYGFNPAYASADPGLFAARHGLRDFVLCVGRLEPRKNQWQLIEIFRTLPHLQLVLIGRFSDKSMEPLIKGFAPPNVRFIERLPFEELVSAYAAARLHVLPSWYELPGLVSLEAAAAGSRVVAGDWGTARDYLGDFAYYASPDDIVRLKAVLLEAYDSPPKPGLREHVLENFTWEKAARRTVEAYRRVLDGR